MPFLQGVQVFNYKIAINGIELSPDMRSLVERVEFVEEINFPSMFRITFLGRRNEGNLMKMLNLMTFDVGNEFRIYMGASMVEPMMTGDIVHVEPKFTDKMLRVEIRGYDRLHKLKVGTRIKTYQEIKDSDLVSLLAGNWGLAADADPTNVTYTHLYQNNISDYDFLKERAERLRYEIGARENMIFFKKNKEAQVAIYQLEYGIDFYHFSGSYSAGTMGDSVDVQGWDYTKKEALKGSARTGDEVSRMDAITTGAQLSQKFYGAAVTAIVDDIPKDEAEATEIAKGRFNQGALETVNARIEIIGDARLRTGMTIKLGKLGRFNGTYYISKSRHLIDQSGYSTIIEMKRTGL